MNRAERRRQRKIAEKEAQRAKRAQPAKPSLKQQALTVEQALALAAEHQAAGRLPQAQSICRQILQADPDQPAALYLLGTIALKAKKYDIAVGLITRAVALKPNNFVAHNNLGNALKKLGRLDEAVASYRNALTINSCSAETKYNLAKVLKLQGLPDEAVASYSQALAIKPRFAEAHHSFCDLLEHTNRTEALRDAVKKARRNCPDDPRFSIWEAHLLKRDGDYAAARAVLEGVGEDVADVRILVARDHLLGELCDRLDDAVAAFRYICEGNRRYKETPEGARADGQRYLARIGALTKRFSSDWIDNWRNVECCDERSDPVFLVGFPRSGTTLLDTILSSHSNVHVVEERPILASARNALARLPGGHPDGLARINPIDLAKLRQTYFAELDKHIRPEKQSAVVIDKLPLNIVDAGLIHRLFPRARFLFMQRHPCDCVLSCFMRQFAINEAMANFLDLEDAAHLYDGIMTLWRQYRTVLPLAVHTVRYERLVEAFEETLTPVLEFVGLGWDDSLRDYAQAALQRGIIKTPSYDQVVQPLYTGARGRWERYRAQMEPVLPILLPWARRFSYGV